MPRAYDLAIVGASFAGLSAARVAAMRGLRVAVIERKRDPGAHVRTTGILVKEAADEADIPLSLTRKVRGVRLYPPSLKHCDHWSPGYYFLATDTPNLLRHLAHEAARAGAHIFLGTRFSGATEDSNGVVLEGTGMRCCVLIGADGAQSAVARAFGLERNRRFLAGVELELEPRSEVDGRFLHCFLDSALAPGYIAWAVPGAQTTQVGLALRHGGKPDIDAAMEKFSRVFNWRTPKIVGRRSGLIPVGGSLSRTYTDRVFLIGDAAGHCSPLTGGGIALAWRYGRRAAQAASDYLCDGGQNPGAVLARERPRFGLKTVLRRALDLGPPNAMWDAAFGSWAFGAFAQSIYFHKRGMAQMPPLDAAEPEAREADAPEF
jgi:geranylgeranyl reductase family protein